MKVSIIHPALLRPGGAESTLLLSAKIFADAGHEVHVYAADYNPEYCQSAAPAIFHRVREDWPKWVKAKAIDRLAFVWKFGSEIAASDVVICHNFPSVIWGAASVRGARKKPFMIWHCHEPRRDLYPEFTDAHILAVDRLSPPDLSTENQPFFELKAHLEEVRATLRNDRNRAWEKRALRGFDLIWCNSHFNAATAKAIYKMPAFVSYPPVLPLQKRAKPKAGGKTIGVLSSFAERKNLANAFRAMVYASKKSSAAEFVIGSHNPEELREWCDRRLPDLTDVKNFRIVNTATAQNLSDFYSMLDLHVYIPLDEPLGLLPIEAARFGVPSLLSDHGGPSEVAGLGFGRTVSPFDYRLAGEQLRLWAEKAWMEIDRIRLPELVEKYFDFPHAMDDLLRVMSSSKEKL